MKAKLLKGIQKYRGLMFAKDRTPVIIDFEKECMETLHMFFVPFNVYAVWIDKEGKIIEGKWLKKWTFGHKPSRPFRKVLEIPEQLLKTNI